MLRRSIARLGVLWIVLGTLSGCGLTQLMDDQLEIRAGLMTMQPKVLPRGVPGSLPGLLLGQIEVQAQVFVRNKMWLDLTLHDVRWRAFVGQRQVATGTAPEGQVLPSDTETPMQLTARISAPALGLAAVDMIRLQASDVAVEVDVEAVALGMHFQRHVRLTGFDLRLDGGALGGALSLPSIGTTTGAEP